MRKDFVDILCCPICKGDLKLKVTQEEREEIIAGEFTCKKCERTYPIKDGIPNLLA